MTAQEILRERAGQLLQMVREQGYRVTPSNLATVAKKAWPTLAKHDDEIDEIANAALRLDTTGSVEGEGAIAKGHDSESDADWPLRTVPAPNGNGDAPHAGAEPPAAPPPNRVKALAHDPERARTGGRQRSEVTVRVLETLKRVMQDNPKASAPQLYDLCAATGIEMCSADTFRSIHVPTIRKELGFDSPQLGGRKAPAASPDRLRKLENAAAAAAEIPAETSAPADLVAAPPEEPAPLPGASARTSAAAHQRPGEVVIAGGSGSFRAVQRADGDWDVEMAATVDPDVMDRLAEVAWNLAVLERRVSA